jgi:hypothetical protein
VTNRDPSGFDLKTDTSDEGPIATFVIVGAVAAATLSAAAELFSSFGWPVPHVVTLWAGISFGVAVGFCAGRTLPTKKQSDNRE